MDIDIDIDSVPAPRHRGRAPAAIQCACGAEWPWTWWESDRPRIASRWLYPSIDPCAKCAGELEAKEERRRFELRQRSVGLPPELRNWSFDRMMKKRPDEPPEKFMARVKRERPVFIGVTPSNTTAITKLKDWTPAHGSLFVHGPTGTGKTILAAATVNRMLTLGSRETKEVPVEKLDKLYGTTATDRIRKLGLQAAYATHVKPGLQVQWLDEEELVARLKLKWSGDKDPLKRISAAQVLVLDDLGVIEKAGRSIATEALERLIAYRYEHGLRLVITSNVPWEQVIDERKPEYGHRVASRLREMCRGQGYTLAGADWRAA